MSNVKILRLNNCTKNPKITQDDDKSGFRYTLSQDLINNGRCMVEVVSGWSQVVQQTIDGEVTTTFRIVPVKIPTLVVRSNIVQEGEDTLTGGAGQILGTMLLKDSSSDRNGEAASLSQTESLTFVTERLPSQIHLERLYWDQNVADATHIPVLVPANTSNAPRLLPFEVVLKLTFLDME
jgi:hypothetical protein